MHARQRSQATLPAPVQRTLDEIAQRDMVIPVMLFVIGHRPLAFVAGQMCHFLDPIGALVGLNMLHDWADVLSDPAQIERLAEELDNAA